MRKRILVVDDELHIAKIIQVTLVHLDFEVTLAHDGKEGLRLAREERPDLIVLDLMLPNIDGFKICRLLKFDKKFSHIPIILVSARSGPEDRELGEQVGADCFFAKPFDSEELAEKVRTFLGVESPISTDSV